MNHRPLERLRVTLHLRKGVQRSLRGAAANTVHNLDPDVSLDIIIKKFTFIYGSVKSSDLLRDFYRAGQEEEESAPSFANKIEGLLCRIREKFPDQIPLQEEQKLLKDRLFHGCGKIYII